MHTVHCTQSVPGKFLLIYLLLLLRSVTLVNIIMKSNKYLSVQFIIDRDIMKQYICNNLSEMK